MGTVSQNHPSPQSSPEVNVTNNQQPGITEDHSQTTIITIGGEVLPEEEVDIPEPDEDEVSKGYTSQVAELAVLLF